MEELSSQNNILIVRIIILIKTIYFGNLREEKLNDIWVWKEKRSFLSCIENILFEIKILSKIPETINEEKKLKNNNNGFYKNQLKKRKNIINNNIIIRNYIIVTLSILINIFTLIKNTIFDLYYFQYSNITLKIKGIGLHTIIGDPDNFEGFDYLKKVYINGNVQNEIECEYYFNQTDNYVELIWDDNINYCQYMFSECEEIIEIDLSNFNTSQVTEMESMFYGCSSLTSINLSNLDTSQVEDMESMFDGCSSLTSLDLSYFDTSQVMYMTYMFCDCLLLTSLNLSNFNTEKVISINNMFYGCINLEYINLNNFDETKLDSAFNLFKNVPDNVVIFIGKSITNDRISQITGKSCPIIDYTNQWKLKQKKLINNNNNECIDSCDNSTQYPYEYNGKCYENCSKGYLLDENKKQTNKCKCELDKCLLCTKVSLYKELCTECNYNYYPKENDPSNLGEYINCYNNIQEGYYLDNNKYIQCYYTCKICNKSGSINFHNCIECNDNYPLKIKKNGYYLNCYENCSYYYYFDVNNIYHCTTNLSCPKEYPKLNEETNECIKNDINDIIKDLIKDEVEILSKKEEIEYYDNLINIIEEAFTSENYDILKLDNGQNEVIKTGKITITLTTLINEKNNINSNLTTIIFGVCENLLKHFYNLSDNETLYLKKTEIAQEGFRIPKVEYDVYSKLFGTNLTKLNLTACENIDISILIPLKLNESLDILNCSSGYFNDICYTTKSEDETDITLKDRKAEFIDKNKTVCQEECLFSNYNNENLKVECSCKVKESSKSISDMNINKTKLLDNFKDIKNFLNFNFLVCYKKLLNKEGIINNIGFYLIFSIILFHIITIFIFYINEFILIKKKIRLIKINKSQINNKEENMKNLVFRNKPNNVSIFSQDKIKNRRKIYIEHIKPINDTSKIKINKNYNIKNKSGNKKLNNLSDYIDDEINELHLI